MSIPPLMGKVIEQKKHNLQKMIDTRFVSVSCCKEATYVTANVGSIGFSVVEAASLITNPGPGLALFGSVSGLIGGIFRIAEGCFILYEGYKEYENLDGLQARRLLLDALLIMGVGILMILASLSTLGLKMGLIAAIAANPYVMPFVFLILVAPGLFQLTRYLIQVHQGSDLGSQVLNTAKRAELIAKIDPAKISDLMEEFSQVIGVEAAIDALELLKRSIENKDIEEQLQKTGMKIAAWNQIVRLRVLQLSLYALMFPLGLASIFLAHTISKVIAIASKLFLTAPSSIGAFLDVKEPFKRNTPITVAKV